MSAVPPPGRPVRRDRRSLLLGVVLGVVISGALALALGPPLLLTHRQDLPFERTYAAAMISLVSRLQAGDARNPLADDPAAVAVGRAAFTGQCALCHGSRGDGRGGLGPATYPDAADLTAAKTVQKSDAQLFWIIRNGLGFTAMPGFGPVYRDEELWALVSYIRALQRGKAEPIEVPVPSRAQLLQADPFGDASARGAAVYFAQGCARCHGAAADAPGDLAIRGRIGTQIVRDGDKRGMPKYGVERISAAELADLEAFLLRFAHDGRGPLVQAAAQD